MIFSELPMAGAWMIDGEPFGDERGSFARTFCRREFAEHGIETDFPQANVSTNPRAGTLRGIHFQLPPHEEGKLVRCSRGRIYDVIVDLRPESESLGETFATELSASNGRQLYIPKGFGHGLLTLEPDSEVSYLMSEYYAPSAVGWLSLRRSHLQHRLAGLSRHPLGERCGPASVRSGGPPRPHQRRTQIVSMEGQITSPSLLEEQQERMMRFVREAYPIFRSLTGPGVRETLELLKRDLPELTLHEVPTGTQVLDWEVPREWRVREAWIKGPGGELVVDIQDHNLHLLGYSVPVHTTLSLAELQDHLYSLEDQPELIPYRTSYYAERWGFCLPHQQREALVEGDYEVFIDSSLEAGSLTYGEFLLEGQSDQEVLVSTHCCHPSLANDNLSGLAVVSSLAAVLGARPKSERRYSYRFLFVPGTVGAITWLALNPLAAKTVSHGLVAANLGDSGEFHYKRSRGGTLSESWPIDRAVEAAAQRLDVKVVVEPFVPFGYDERQYCSPGFDLPVGSLSRTPWGRYPEYHTSADNLDLVSAEALAGSLELFLGICAQLEQETLYRSTQNQGEPQLGRRGLYRTLGGDDRGRERELALLWVLSLADGKRSVSQICERSGTSAELIDWALNALAETELLEQV